MVSPLATSVYGRQRSSELHWLREKMGPQREGPLFYRKARHSLQVKRGGLLFLARESGLSPVLLE